MIFLPSVEKTKPKCLYTTLIRAWRNQFSLVDVNKLELSMIRNLVTPKLFTCMYTLAKQFHF